MKTKTEFQRRIYPEHKTNPKKGYGVFPSLSEAVKDMPFTVQVQSEDLEDFDVCPEYMEVIEIRDDEDYNIMYWIEEKHLKELETNQAKHF